MSDKRHKDLTPADIYEAFVDHYVDGRAPLELVSYKEIVRTDHEDVAIEAKCNFRGESITITGEGNGIISALCRAIEEKFDISMEVVDYREHSMSHGTKSRAISYIQIADSNGGMYFGAGTSSNITKSGLRAVISTTNKIIA